MVAITYSFYRVSYCATSHTSDQTNHNAQQQVDSSSDRVAHNEYSHGAQEPYEPMSSGNTVSPSPYQSLTAGTMQKGGTCKTNVDWGATKGGSSKRTGIQAQPLPMPMEEFSQHEQFYETCT